MEVIVSSLTFATDEASNRYGTLKGLPSFAFLKPFATSPVIRQTAAEKSDEVPLAIDFHGLGWPEIETRNHVTLLCYVEERPRAAEDIGNILVGKIDDRILNTPTVLVALGIIAQRPVNRECHALNIFKLQIALLQIPDVLGELLMGNPFKAPRPFVTP